MVLSLYNKNFSFRMKQTAVGPLSCELERNGSGESPPAQKSVQYPPGAGAGRAADPTCPAENPATVANACLGLRQGEEADRHRGLPPGIRRCPPMRQPQPKQNPGEGEGTSPMRRPKIFKADFGQLFTITS
jgi:hypothetical protein